MTAIALVAAGLSTLWAALFVLAEEAPGDARRGDGGAEALGTVPLARGLQVGRLALVSFAALLVSGVLVWWRRPPAEGALTVAVGGACLYLLTEGLPRRLALLAPGLAGAAVPLARRALAPFGPLILLLGAGERWVSGFLPPPPRRRDAFGRGQRDMLLGLLSLEETTVAEVMTPRLDIVALEDRASVRDVVELLRRSEHARIPVFTEDLDHIVGILYAKDLTPSTAGIADLPATWQELVRPAQFVPESKSLAAQLRDFQRGPSHIAIVVDEFGGTSGLVTLEDILEEVVGEIYDEYDVEEEPEVEQEGADRYWVDGRVSLDDLAERLGTRLEAEDVATVGGLIYAELGRVPRPGEELRIGDFRVVVEQVARRRVRRVYFERLRDPARVEAGRGGGL